MFRVGEDEIRWHKPVVYQEKNGTRQEIAAHYSVTDTNRVGFEVARYDTRRPLYIDPLIYSTYLGGNGSDGSFGIAVDSAGNAYVTGGTSSTNFPTVNPLQPTYGGGGDAFVAKINPSGSALVYSTYLGGSSYECGESIAVDSAGNAYVTGGTSSTNFPTVNPLQPTYGGGEDDAFVAKINPQGSALVYSTYLGGSSHDFGDGIAVDSAGDAYVTGNTTSTNFPTTPGTFQTNFGGGWDAFVAKINPEGSALVYSTYLGGSSYDYGQGIAVDSAGNAYVIGGTSSTNFPTTPGTFQTNFGGGWDAFVAKINPEGSALVYSTYLGGSGSDTGEGIAVDSAGNAYVTGGTNSIDFPVTPGAFQTTNHGSNDAYVTKLNSTGSALVYSTYLGGGNTESPNGIAVDSSGNAYVVGTTYSNDFPITPGAFQIVCNSGNVINCDRYGDAFVSKLNPSGSALVYSAYLGGSGNDWGNGIAVDSSGNAYVTGETNSLNFPRLNPLQRAYGGGDDAFVTKIDMRTVTTTILTSTTNPSTYGQAVVFTAKVTSKAGAPPDGQTVSFKKGTTVLGTGALSGGSATFTTSTLAGGTDTITAVYAGDNSLVGSTSKAVKQVVSKATTTTTLASSLNPSNYKQSVTFTVSVTPQFSGTVTGTVTFYDGTTLLKTVGLSGGKAKFTTSTLASGTLPHSRALRKSGVLVLDGYGIRVQVSAGHLVLHDGIGDERRTIRLPRVNHGLKRLAMIGSDGFITLEALRWLADQGAAFVMLDRRGKVLAVTGPVSSSDAKLRRAQALALGNGTALKISKELISQKIAGQELLVRDMLHDSATADAIARFRTDLPSAESIESVRLIESQAARAYWQAWSDLPIRWPRKDERRVPEHWKRFGSRISPLTHSPRLASSPPNALLNFLYGLLESEARLSAVVMGLDPAIGFLHVDTPNRDSLACDLMEVCRPCGVDAFVLNWLQSEPLRRSDFWEDRNGNCRITSSLAIKLCDTSDTWRRLVAPAAEYVSQEFWCSIPKPASTPARQLIATRLTQRKKREVKGSDVPGVKHPTPEHVCSGCGKPVQDRSAHCADCAVDGATERLAKAARIGRVAARSPEARAKHAASRRRHAQACSEWDSSTQPAWLTSEVFSQKIQPLLASFSASAIRSRIGVSRWYAGRIRQG